MAFPQMPNNSVQTYILPMFEKDPTAREEQVAVHREGYLYGPPLMGNSSYFPAGKLGDALVQEQLKTFNPEAEELNNVIEAETKAASAAVAQVRSYSWT